MVTSSRQTVTTGALWGRRCRRPPVSVAGYFLLQQLRVLVERHRLVLEAAVQVELVREVKIELRRAGRHELDEAALSQREDGLRGHVRVAQNDDLSIGVLV